MIDGLFLVEILSLWDKFPRTRPYYCLTLPRRRHSEPSAVGFFIPLPRLCPVATAIRPLFGFAQACSRPEASLPPMMSALPCAMHVRMLATSF